MATLSYTVLQGETIWDIAAKLYSDFPTGISDLLALNNITLNGVLPQFLVYTQDKKRNIKRINVPIINNPNKQFITREGQSHFDLAIQLYGNFSGIANILAKASSLDDDIVTGTVFEYSENESQESFLFRSFLVATKTINGYVLLETGFKITLEDGSGAIRLG